MAQLALTPQAAAQPIDVSGGMSLEEIERRKKLAQALQANAQQPVQNNFQAMTSVLSNALGTYSEGKLADQEKAALAEALKGAGLTDQQQATLSGLGPTASREVLAKALAEGMTPTKPEYKEVDGNLLRISNDGVESVYSAPQKPQYKTVGNTLGQITDGGFKPLYSAPESSKMSENERQYNELLKRGYEPDAAYALANGFMQLSPPNQFGEVQIKNLMEAARGGRQAPLPTADQLPPSNDGSAGQYISLPEPDNTGFTEDIREGTGFWGNIGDIITAATDMLTNNEAVDPASINSAKTRLKTFNQLTKSALVNNPKFPVAEQKNIDAILVQPDAFFTSPGRQLEKAMALQKVLTDTKQLMQEDLDTGRITAGQKGLYANKISEIERALSMMGDLQGAAGQLNGAQPPAQQPSPQQGSFTLPDGDTVTQEEINFTAQQYGISPEEVKNQLGIR